MATFIKEVVFEPVDKVDFVTPGDYLQFDIPAYDAIRFRDLDIPQPYAAVWEAQQVFDLVARNPAGRPAQQLLVGLRSRHRIRPPLQRPPRHAAVGTRLPARRRLGVHVQPQTGRQCQRRRAVRRLSTSNPPRRKWSTSAAVPAWPPCGPT